MSNSKKSLNANVTDPAITKEENCCGTNIVRAVIYTRTALIERTALADQTGSYVKQVITCSAYISKKGWVLCEIFFDEGVSGNTIERPELSLMIEKAAKYCFDIIVISSLDRLARDPEKIIEISKILRDFHVTLQSADESENVLLRSNGSLSV
jgi:DNA invertase Pin-like site-specific DNA recombinase